MTFSLAVNIILPTMPQARTETIRGDGRTATAAAVKSVLGPERKLLPEGNVAIVRRYTNNAHRILFSVEIGQILEYPYTRGSNPGETEARVDVLEAAQMARSEGRITDEFVVGRNERFPSLIGIKPVDPDKRVLTVEAPRDRTTGRLNPATLRVPGYSPAQVTYLGQFLETLGDIKEGTVFDSVVSQFFYDMQQGLFDAEPTGYLDY